jgi:hypothetical protein
MGVPKGFWDDMKYLRTLYGWSDAERDDIKAWVEGDDEAVLFCQQLAMSWRCAERGVYQPMSFPILEAA